ncbi:MAG: CPBP family intramembrane metalloprotease [Planctomycetes bacterium]|nr:CPBP family intramembrane metalloprotease [Planctomycetota bacterium]
MRNAETGTDRRLGGWGNWLAPIIAAAIAGLYCTAFFVRPPSSWPSPWSSIGAPGRWLVSQLRIAFYQPDVDPQTVVMVGGATFFALAAGVVPWLIMASLRRGRPSDLGMRLPNPIGWRLLIVGFLIALPFVAWMARGEGFAAMYLPKFQRAPAAAVAYYFVNFFVEHFFFHGVMLAAFRRQGRWPDLVGVSTSAKNGVRRGLQWFGLAQATGDARGWRRITRWIGLPEGCLFAMVASAALFGWIHMSKDPREFLLSFPGGVALAYIAYRTNTWLVPFALHALTAGTACLLALAWS